MLPLIYMCYSLATCAFKCLGPQASSLSCVSMCTYVIVHTSVPVHKTTLYGHSDFVFYMCCIGL